MGQYDYRYIARFVIEAESPISIGCGDHVVTTDSPVIKDVNGLPYIPGSSLAGVIRHSLPDKTANDFMGYQDKNGGEGSKLIISDATIVDENGEVIEGLCLLNGQSQFLSRFSRLPIRQHVRISEKGTAVDKGKFDEEIVYKGTRFCFEMEVLLEQDDTEFMNSVIGIVGSSHFRVGSGTRNGFGLLKVVSCRTRKYILSDKADLKAYISKTASLNDRTFDGQETIKQADSDRFVDYRLSLHADDFIFFSSGLGDADADNVHTRESVIKWKGGKAHFSEEQILIPATSVKGAIAHRTVYHYNKEHGIFAGSSASAISAASVGPVGSSVSAAPETKSPVLKELFGDVDGKHASAGKCFFTDVFISDCIDKVMNHVAVDRFTGGTIAGALFQEKTVYAAGKEIVLCVSVDKSVDSEYFKPLESALSDICKGLLPLGGSVNRGYGLFTGKLYKNGEEIQI